jgi:hypothetical protein
MPRTLPDASQPDPCPLCNRPNLRPTDHHLVPRCRGGKVTETLCRDCHKAIHSVFSNKELEKTYNTVEALMAHETFRKMIAYIAKQDPTRKVTFKLTKEQQRRGRNG